MRNRNSYESLRPVRRTSNHQCNIIKLFFMKLITYFCDLSMFSRSINNMHKGLVFNFNFWKCFSNKSSIWAQWLYHCFGVVSIQVPFENVDCSTTEKQLRWSFELCNETLRQVCKTSVNIVCSCIHNLLVMQFRCLRVSCALHVMFVEKTIRVMWKWFETFYTF